MTDYNGWKTEETWSLYTVISNIPELRRAFLCAAQYDNGMDEEALTALTASYNSRGRNAITDMIAVNFLRRVDWRELADALKQAATEDKR